MTFQFDTSGTVFGSFPTHAGTEAARFLAWSDLDPFTQGYIEALMVFGGYVNASGQLYLAFSDLAAETLARIRQDCAAWVHEFPGWGHADGGRLFWGYRHRRLDDGSRVALALPRFPPQTPYLGEDGKVYLR